VYTSAMAKATFRLIQQKDGGVSVELTKANGTRRLVPDFRDEAEAKAWIVQTDRLLATTDPNLPGAKRQERS
jgi:hypothetical protein